MQFNDSTPEKSANQTEKQQKHSKLNFLSSISLVCSIVSILCSSFLFYNFFALQQELKTTRQALNQAIAVPSAVSTSPTNPPLEPAEKASSPTQEFTDKAENQPTESITQNSTEPAVVKPGIYIQSGFDKRVQVELLRVNRIQNQKTGDKDLVNVRFRVRRVGESMLETDMIETSKIIGRNPVSSQQYVSLNTYGTLTGEPVQIGEIAKGASVDAYVWLQVPAEVQTIDILIPNVEDFEKVPIDSSNQSSKNLAEVKPGAYVQPAFGGRARIELLQVNRIQHPTTGKKNLVNVQFQINRVADRMFGNDWFNPRAIKSRNPETSEVGTIAQSAGTVELEKINKEKPMKTNVWLYVPDGVNAIDIIMPQTQIFENVPIKNLSNPS